eukprot:scaffold627_cov144-Skeletonema_menzelii.AAC.32
MYNNSVNLTKQRQHEQSIAILLHLEERPSLSAIIREGSESTLSHINLVIHSYEVSATSLNTS